MTTHQPSVHHLDLRIRQMDQLFNSLDPTPFLNKDLDHDAEAFMETWAQTKLLFSDKPQAWSLDLINQPLQKSGFNL